MKNEKIGTINSKYVILNRSDLFRFKGFRLLRNRIERNIGFLLLIIAAVFIGIFVNLLISEEINTPQLVLEELLSVDSPEVLMFYVAVFLILYAAYLLRSKDIFGYSLEDLNLGNGLERLINNEIDELEVENYVTEEIIGWIDEIYFSNKEKFISEISKKLLKEKNINKIIEDRVGIDTELFKDKLSEDLETQDTSFDSTYQKFFLDAFQNAVQMKAIKIHHEVLFISLALSYWSQTLKEFDVNKLEIQGMRIWLSSEIKKRNYKRKWRALSRLKPRGAINKAFTARRAPLLEQYGIDLTYDAIKNGMTVSLGKEQAIENIENLLSKEDGSAVLLIGEPGVGKTFLLRDLATKTVVEDLPKAIQDMRVVSVNLNSITAISFSLDEFKNIINQIFEEVAIAGNIILILEEIDQLFEIRQDIKMEIINLILNEINQKSLKVVATSTRDDYYRKIRPAKSFSSQFNIVELLEPDEITTFQIIMDYVPELEKTYRVKITTNAIKRIIQFSSKFNYEKSQPDKALDLLNEVLTNASERGKKQIENSLVDEVIKSKVGVDVGKIGIEEGKKLSKLEDILHTRIVGQNRAVKAVSAALRRARSGLNSEQRPVASFLFYGPTGVGKTEVAKTLSDVYYGDEKLMIRLDMSEYHELSNLDRLIGYQDSEGNFRGGNLTEEVRKKPYSLILLDEIEKANPKVMDLFLQILDEGSITDGMGRTVDFTNTIIIATSNAGSRKIAEFIDKKYEYKQIEKETLNDLRDAFRVEFLNRFDKIIMFEPLRKIEIIQIADILLGKLNKNLDNKNIKISWDHDTLSSLGELGYDPVYGARELRRVIQEEIEDKIATLVVEGRVKSGSMVHFKGLEVSGIA